MQTDKNYYRILKLDNRATSEQIRKAYRTLAAQYHPDVNDSAEAVRLFQELQEAYEILGDLMQRRTYDGLRKLAGYDKPSAINLQTITSHKLLLTNMAEQVLYVLLNIEAASNLPTSRLPLNLCLVLDRSTSMQGLRLQQVKKATYKIIEQLDKDDALSVVIFSDRAQVVLPSQSNIDKRVAGSIISAIQPGGGTEMLSGLSTGLKELKVNRSQSSVNHLILLTDGQTYGDEAECLEKAEWAGHHQITLNTMGLGSDWNESFLDQMATSAGGKSTYIDSPTQVVDVFNETFRELGTVVARELTMQINPAAGVVLTEAFQTVPNAQRLDIGHDKIALGSLSRTQGKELVLEFKISQQANPGKNQLLRLKIDGDIPIQNNYRNWESMNIFGEFVADIEQNQRIPAAIVGTLRKLALFKMQEKAMNDVENGKFNAASQKLENLATQLLNLGEADLARVTLLEAGRLARTGHLSASGQKKIRYGTRSLSI